MINRWSETALRRWALGLLLLVAGLVAFAIAVEPQLHGLTARQRPNAPEFDAGYAVIGCSLVLVGVLLGWLRPRNPIGWLLLLAGLCGSICNAGQVYGSLAIAAPDKNLPFGYLVLAMSAPLWIPALVIPATLVLARFPGGVVTGRWARLIDRTSICGLAVLYLGYANAPNAITDEIRTSSPPHLVPKTVAWVVAAGGGFLLLLGLIGTVVTTIHRMIRSGAPERQQIVLLLMATVAAVAGVILAPPWLGFIAFLLVPVAIAVGVLRYRLLGVDVVVRRTLLYATLTGLVLAVFVAVTAALAAAIPHGPAPVVVAASLIAVGLAPARDRLQKLVDRLVYGYRADPWSALARLSSPLGSSAGEDLLTETAAALAGALRVPCVEVRDRGGDVLARWGAGAAPRELPLRFGVDELGTLAIGLRPGEEVLASAELRLVNAITPLVAVVVHALTLTADLETAQQRLRDAVHTERQRLRQDLHDGLGPSLTGIGFGLEALESGMGAASAGELVGRLRSEAASALDEVRRIIDDLRPGALDEQGLLEALHSRVRHVQHGTGLHLELSAPQRLDLGPEVEVAAYRIVEEALTNVVKHANATRCSINITVDDALHVVVGDDGVGLRTRPPNGAGGVGMLSMRDRAERLGGTFSAADREPGTEIRVDLPLEVR